MVSGQSFQKEGETRLFSPSSSSKSTVRVCVCLFGFVFSDCFSPSLVDHHYLPTMVFLFWTRIFYYARLSNSHFYYALMMPERCAVVSAYIGLCQGKRFILPSNLVSLKAKRRIFSSCVQQTFLRWPIDRFVTGQPFSCRQLKAKGFN